MQKMFLFQIKILDRMSFRPKHDNLIRKSTYSIKEVHDKVKDILFEKDKRLAKVDFDGDLIKGNSQRYQTFFTKGCKCAICGIEGKFSQKKIRRPINISSEFVCS